MSYKIEKILLICILTIAVACKSGRVESSVDIDSKDTPPSMVSDSLEVRIYSGAFLAHKFITPRLERFMMLDTPYMEFKEGIHLESFDSLQNITTMLDSDYAHYNEKINLWEARGNVIARDSLGKTLYTEQLFMDEKNKLIFSNVKTRVVDGDEVTVGSGFESEDKLENIVFKGTRGRILVDTTRNSVPDTLATDSVEIDESIEKTE